MNLRRGNRLQGGGRKANCLMSILQTAKWRAERETSSDEEQREGMYSWKANQREMRMSQVVVFDCT